MTILLREWSLPPPHPRQARLPMTPEEVAASYAEAEQETDDDPKFGDPGYDDRDTRDSDDGDAGGSDDDAGGHDADDNDEVSCRSRTR